MAGFKKTFASLHHENFRYFWIGQSISTIGGMVQITALSWYVYKISGSPFLLGLMSIFEFGPILLLTLFAGVFLERFPKKKILLITQSIFLAQSLSLSLLVWMGSTNYWLFAFFALVAGITNSIDQPTRQSYFVELVGKEDLSNAISLNSTSFNLARILGPAIAGLIMKSLGIAACFFINGLSFIPVLYGITKITIQGTCQITSSGQKIVKEIKKGVAYTMRNNYLLPTFLIMMAVCTFAMNSNVILPVFAKDILLQDEGIYTLMMSVLGLGSMLGALFMARRGNEIKNRYFLVITAISIGVLQMLTLLFLHTFYIILIILLFMGFLTLCFLNRANARIQLNTADRFRGRVMSIYVLINTGSTPIGNSFTGLVMDIVGEKYGYFSNGLLSLILVFILFYIYKKQLPKARVVARSKRERAELIYPPHGENKC